MDKGGVLFLDLARQATGWAYGCSYDEHPETGAWVLPGDDNSRGMTFAALENEVLGKIYHYRPGLLALESPFVSRFDKGPLIRLQIGNAAVIEYCAYRENIPFREVTASAARKRVIGRALLTKEEKTVSKDVKKVLVEPFIRSRGWTIRDHNARDAAIGLCYMLGFDHEKRMREPV